MSFETPKLRVIRHPSKAITKKKLWSTPPKPLPPLLYHTTTALESVLKHGIKSRDELAQSLGAGLGGGSSNLISFTTEFAVAAAIRDTLRDYHAFLNNEITLSDLEAKAAKYGFQDKLDATVKASVGDYHKIINEGWKPRSGYIERASEIKAKGGIPIDGWKGGDGEMRHILALYPATEDDILQAKSSFFKAYLMYDESSGSNRFNPLFFMEDTHAIKNMDPYQIAILQYRSRPHTLGFKETALAEWRAFSEDVILDKYYR